MGTTSADSVVVAVKAEKVISKTALAWALTHVARPGDSITFLAVVSIEKAVGRGFWGFRKWKGDSRSNDPNRLLDRIRKISASCSQMVLQFHDQTQVGVRIKVVSTTSSGVVAAEAKSKAATWVILDKKLKRELKHCVDELQCSIIQMKGSQPKVVRLNLMMSDEIKTPFFSAASSPILETGKLGNQKMKHSTPVSSPGNQSTTYTRTSGDNSVCSRDTGASSLFVIYEQNPLFEGLNNGKPKPSYGQHKLDYFGERTIAVPTTEQSETLGDKRIFWISQNHNSTNSSANPKFKNISKIASPNNHPELDNFYNIGTGGFQFSGNMERDYAFNPSIREAMSLGRASSTPPPLCSLCQSKAPAFGKPPRQFDYEELEEATNGFSDTNFLAESGFGVVHRGLLRDGLIIAVKQLKFVGPQRDTDFCREVQVLSCAQHRNVVLLIGFCIHGKKRLLVYEYICNRSLDFHLHGNGRKTLDWQSRWRIAIGTARGLRYLHEDCRVGCIVHRDMRPNNILLTHDFEPMVADFGLARLHSEWRLCDGDRVVGTSGYLAPEYFEGGKITEKVDTYAFGIVLLELITGRKSTNLQCPSNQFLSDNFHPSAANGSIQFLAHKSQLLDPRLISHQVDNLPFELQAMGRAASLCLQRDPDLRPPMSKVLRILEGGDTIVPLAFDLNTAGSRSGYLRGPDPITESESKGRHSRRLSY